MSFQPISEPAQRDAFLDGQIVLEQLGAGYRAGIDAPLLAAALDLKPGQRAAEFGCGAGAALLCAAALYPHTELIGIERESDAATLARRNVEANAMTDRVSVESGDALAWRPGAELDAVFFNPPFFDDPTAVRAPKREKHAAWMSEAGIEAWITAGLKRLKSGGRLTVIHRADALAAMLTALTGKAGAIAVRPIQPRADQPAKRVIIQATKTAKGPLRLLPALVLHADASSAFAPQADRILRGRERLALQP